MYRYCWALAGLLIAMVLLTGCGAGGPAPSANDIAPAAAPPTTRFWPLKGGYQWTMAFTTYATPVSEYPQLDLPVVYPATATTSTVLYKCTGTMTATNGSVWYKFTTTTNGSTLTEKYYYRNVNNGLVCHTDHMASPWFLIKTPLTVGNKWLMLPAPTNAYRQIMATNASTTVPAGTFTGCLVVTQTYANETSKNLVVKYWYAPNKGLVRWESRTSGVLTAKAVLKSTNVPNP